jgi:hypothetical protein
MNLKQNTQFGLVSNLMTAKTPGSAGMISFYGCFDRAAKANFGKSESTLKCR